MIQEWVLQTVLCDDPGAMAVDWDTFNIGVVEDGVFRSIYSCWCLPDAEHLLSALRWYSTFSKDGIIKEPVQPVPQTKKRKKVSDV
jgi:hypothetical protein